jgi:outer membrane protein TolC
VTLRQAIEEAPKQNRDAALARAGIGEANAAAVLARSQVQPAVIFAEDMSRSNDTCRFQYLPYFPVNHGTGLCVFP